MDLEKAKAELLEKLQAPDIDRDAVLALASAIAESDPNFVRFTVDASHISRLGLELVSRQETAVAELVKNAYDADATQVDLTFSNSDARGGTLEIWDNGSGMTRGQLISGFMKLSTTAKVTEPMSLKYKRPRAGKKGIGRFAAQRLGSQLTIVTQAEGAENALKVTIDWDRFAGRDLFAVSNPIEVVPPMGRRGTSLTISNLRDRWTRTRIQRSSDHVAELIQPFPLSDTLGQADGDPGFHVDFFKENRQDLQLVVDAAKTYFDCATAEIEAHVDKQGNGTCSVKSALYGIDTGPQPIGPEKDAPLTSFPAIRDVHLRAYYFLEPDLPRQVRSKVLTKLRDDGGIRLYRNGFRVLPYGGRYDDWLRLDVSYRKRFILPPHGNQNFLGFVQVVDPRGERFEETSSREGLVDNEAFQELRDFLYNSIVKGVLEIAEARGRKPKAGGPAPPRPPTQTADELEELARQLPDLVGKGSGTVAVQTPPDQASPPDMKPQVQSVQDKLFLLASRSREMMQELEMMRVLASLGLTIGEFTHEVALGFEAIEADASSLAGLVATNEKAKKVCSRLVDRFHTVNSYIDYFEEAVRDNVAREVKPLEIRDVINAFEGFVEPRKRRQQIQFEKEIDGVGLFTKPMHRSEWMSVLVNLFTNSLKAIKRANVAGVIRVKAGRAGDRIYLEFCDNGDGIKEAHRSRIFDAFFTTSPQAAAGDSLAGMGLGLKIVKDILENAHGSIALVDAAKPFTTCFRIDVPAASNEEIPVDAY